MAIGAKSSISTTALALVAVATPLTYGTAVKSAAANTQKLYVGVASTVTSTSADATDGYELSPGEEVFIPKTLASDLSSVYVIAAGGSGQRVCYAAA